MAYQAIGPGIRDGGGTTPPAQSRQMRAMMIGGGMLLLLIGLGLIGSATLFASKQAQLREEGTTIVADVLDTQATRTTRRGTVTSTRYEVKYRFQPMGQAAVTSGWEDAPEDVVRAATQTKTIEVRYLPSDPGVNLPSASVGAESGSGVASIWQLSVGAGLTIMGLGIVFLAGKSLSTPRPSAGRPVM